MTEIKTPSAAQPVSGLHLPYVEKLSCYRPETTRPLSGFARSHDHLCRGAQSSNQPHVTTVPIQGEDSTPLAVMVSVSYGMTLREQLKRHLIANSKAVFFQHFGNHDVKFGKHLINRRGFCHKTGDIGFKHIPNLCFVIPRNANNVLHSYLLAEPLFKYLPTEQAWQPKKDGNVNPIVSFCNGASK